MADLHTKTTPSPSPSFARALHTHRSESHLQLIAIVSPIVDTRRGLFGIAGSQPTASGAGTVSLGLVPVYEARLAYREVS